MNMLTFPYWLIVKFDLHMSSVISENSFHSGSFTCALYPHENIICSKNVPILHTRYVPYGKIGPLKIILISIDLVITRNGTSLFYFVWKLSFSRV